MNGSGDRKGNITAAFGCDIVLGGMTAVPNLILKYYSKLGITDREMMLLIQMMFLHTSHNNSFPSYDELSKIMACDEKQIKIDLASLIEKGVITITHFYSEEQEEIIQVYSYEPLFEKVSELWACQKVAVYQKMKKSLKDNGQESRIRISRQKAFTSICRSFEKEFARLLSPMEIEQVNLWLDDFEGNPEMILEALKKAVMMGKHNFKYIDSILLDWRKNNIKSIAEVSAFEAGFRERQASKPVRRKNDTTLNKKDKFKLLYLG